MLDIARHKVLEILFPGEDWQTFRDLFPDPTTFHKWLCNELDGYSLSDQAVGLLCYYNDFRATGNKVAHDAIEDELVTAISRYEGPYKEELVSLFKFSSRY